LHPKIIAIDRTIKTITIFFILFPPKNI